MLFRNILLCALFAAVAPACAHAGDAGSWEFKFGVHNVNPKSNNGSLAGGTLKVDISSETRPTFNLGYWLTDNWQLDVLAAIPFRHSVKLNGAKAADFDHLPPTVTLQYHFAPQDSIDPFVGIGLNYTLVYSESTKGPLAGTRLGLDNSFGLAAQAGVTFKINDSWRWGADVRWLNIDSDAKVNGAGVGTVHVDPVAVGVFAIYKF